MTRKITPPPGMDFPSQTFPRKQASILSGPQSHSGDKPITNLLLSGLSQKWDWGHEGVGQVWHTFFTFFLLEVYDMLLQLFTMCVKHVVPVHTYVPEVLLCTSYQAKYQVLVSTVVFVIYPGIFFPAAVYVLAHISVFVVCSSWSWQQST